VSYRTIRYEVAAPHVALLTLARPEVANALNGELFEELDDAVRAIDGDDDIHVWILTGAPRIDGRPWFSAGADMKEPAGPHPNVDPAAVVDRIDALLKPSIAAIGGMCTTGALELAMACDLRIAATSARLSDWHLKTTGLGIGQWGAATRLSRLVGIDKAKELLLTGVEVSGEDAARMGLVNRAVPEADLMDHAVDVAAAIAAMPRRGVRSTLAHLEMTADMSKREAIGWARLTPEYTGLRLRPFIDAAERFSKRDRATKPAPGTTPSGLPPPSTRPQADP